MKKIDEYKVSRYQKSNSLLMANGGTLIITENEYIIKYLFMTVARFEIDKTLISKIPDNLFSWFDNGLCLNDGNKSIDLYFLISTAEKLYKRLGIES